MRAMQYQRYGGPEQLRLVDVPRPVPGPRQLLVRVAACAVNPIDWKLHDGSYRWFAPVRFPSTPGFDLAGDVVEVGAEVRRFHPGDAIYAMADVRPGGACAEYAVISERAAAYRPANLSAIEAAAIPVAGLTALQSLRDLGHMRAGQRVLVIGAAGGVGHYAAQLAHAWGTDVTAVCGPRHVEMVRGLGADRVIDYTREPNYLAPARFDLRLDTVVRAPPGRLLAALRPLGIYVATLPSAARVAAALALPLVSGKRVLVASVKPRGGDLELLRGLCEA